MACNKNVYYRTLQQTNQKIKYQFYNYINHTVHTSSILFIKLISYLFDFLGNHIKHGRLLFCGFPDLEFGLEKYRRSDLKCFSRFILLYLFFTIIKRKQQKGVDFALFGIPGNSFFLVTVPCCGSDTFTIPRTLLSTGDKLSSN